MGNIIEINLTTQERDLLVNKTFADPTRTLIDILNIPSTGGGIRHISEL